MADTIRNENKEKKIKVKAPKTAKKINSTKLQTAISPFMVTTSAAAELCVDLPPVKISAPRQHWF